jgi:hypothetical protein
MDTPGSDALVSACRDLRDRIERSRDAIDAEIRSYPTPIPRCDAQFNHLYEERARLTRLLQLDDEALALLPNTCP